jgi:hypothetical protein
VLEQNEILDRLRGGAGGDPFLGQRVGGLDLRGHVLDFCLNLTGARIAGPVDLSNAKLLRGFRAPRAFFEGPVRATDAEWSGDITFSNTTFASTVDLSWTKVRGRIWAWRARFHGDITFFQTVVSPGEAQGTGFVFPGETNFSWAWFWGKASFERMWFQGPAYFWRTRFFDNSSFNECCFFQDAAFMGKVSEVCLARDEIGPDFFARLELAGLLRPGTEEYVIIDGRKVLASGHLNVNSLQDLQIAMSQAGLSEPEQNRLAWFYQQHSGQMFGKEMSFQRVRIEKPKQVQFMGVNAHEWNLSGTDIDAISYFNSEQEPVPHQVGLGHVYRTVFISYGGPDEQIARRFNDALRHSGVETYFYKEDAVPGRVIVEEMQAQIAKFDRVLLICSRSAPQRPGWRFEVEHALQRENSEGTGRVLLPVSIDDCLDADSPWHQDRLLKTLCEQNVTPFQGTLDDSAKFNKSLGRILTALESDELPAPPAGSPPPAGAAA